MREDYLRNSKAITFNTQMSEAVLKKEKRQMRIAVGCDITAQWKLNHTLKHPKYEKCSILWIREPAKVTSETKGKMEFSYLVDGKNAEITIPERFIGNKVNIYGGLPKWIYEHRSVPNGCIREMARIFIRVVDVRIERLQEISNIEIELEGAPYQTSKENECLSPLKRKENLQWWIKLWDSTSKDGDKWKDDPYVFIYDFKVIYKKDV